jgi:hypothetical protein
MEKVYKPKKQLYNNNNNTHIFMNLVFKTNKINNTAADYDVANCECTNDGCHNANHESSCAINLKHLYFSEPIQNSIIHDSYFIRMNYSDNDVSLTGLILPVKLSFITISKSFNKNIIMYDLHSNKEVISNICKLETLILEKYSNFLNSVNNSNTLKIPVYNLSTQLKSCSIKLFSDIDKRTQECNIILKISGIWENIREYGITFKFMDLHS